MQPRQNRHYLLGVLFDAQGHQAQDKGRSSGCIQYAWLFKDHFAEEFEQAGRASDKKFMYQSVSIKEGNSFDISSKGKKRQRSEEEMQEFHLNEREGPIDTCLINYADFTALQLMGVISINNYKHLKMIPSERLSEASLVIQVFKTILKEHKCNQTRR